MPGLARSINQLTIGLVWEVPPMLLLTRGVCAAPCMLVSEPAGCAPPCAGGTRFLGLYLQ